MKKNSDYPKWKLFFELGKRNIQLHENESAINVLTKSIKIKQDNEELFFYRGLANRRLGKHRDAINDFTKSLEIKENVDSYIERGKSYNSLNIYKNALIDLNFAYKLIPFDNFRELYEYDILHHKGIAFYGLKKYITSVVYYSKAIKLTSNEWNIFYNRGLAYFYLENWQKSNSDYKEAIKRNPDNENLLICYEQLSLINIKLKNFEEVEKYAKKGFSQSIRNNWNGESKLTDEEKEKINKYWLLFLGFANIKLNNFEKAEYWLEQINFLYINRPNIRSGELICRAFTLTHLDKYDKALEYIDKAFRHKRVFGWDFAFSEINELINEFPVAMKNIIRIKYQFKFNE